MEWVVTTRLIVSVLVMLAESLLFLRAFYKKDIPSLIFYGVLLILLLNN